MQLYHVSENCGFRKNRIVSIQPIGWAKKSKKYAVLLSTYRDFSSQPDQSNASIPEQTWHFCDAAREKFQRAMQMDHMNWRQTIEITYKFSHGLKVR